MCILDRYILWMFFKALFVCFFSLAGLFVVIDSFGNLEEFINLGRQQGSLVTVLIEYYGARVVAFFDRTCGILTLTAAIFTITWLQRHNEMTAMMAAGIRKFRIVIPIIISVVLINILTIATRELLIPSIRDKLTRNAQDWFGDSAQPLHPRYDNETDILILGGHTIAKDLRLDKPNFRLPARFSEFGRQLAAKDAIYHPPTDDRPGGYWLRDVYQPSNLSSIDSATMGPNQVILSPHDTPWLGSDECFVVSKISFDQLAGGKAWQQYASTAELMAGLRNPSLDYSANVRVTVHSRIVRPLLDVTLLFLGLPLILTRRNRNVFVAIGLCIVLVQAFYFVVLACQGLGNHYLISPSLAAWAPLIILVPVAAALAEPLWQ